MSLTRKASSPVKKAIKPPRQDLAAALAEREAELAEARRQQAATAEILRTISQAPTDTQPVFERIVVSAVRLLGCDLAVMLLRDGDAYIHAAAATADGPMDLPPERFPIDASLNFPSRAFLDKTMSHLPDWSRTDLTEHERHIHESFGIDSAFYLPMLRDDESIGVLVIAGRRPNSFGPSEIAHAESFCDQALIAIENARLFRETQESLERQTATAEVLKVIASSPSDVRPVFDAIATTANRLLEGHSTTVWRFVDDALILVAFTRTTPSADEALQAAFPRPLAEFPPFLTVRDGRTQEVVDTEAETGVPAILRDLGRLRGFRSMAMVPLRSGGAAIGMISVTRKEPGAFAAADVQLLRTFADQAVIAINNADLFNETQEALEQQKAASEVLQVISRSTFDLQSVFRTLVENAVRLCGAKTGMIFRRAGAIMRVAAASGATPEFVAYVERNPIAPGRGAITGRAALDGRTVHVLDIENDPEYSYGGLSLERYRTIVAVPLMRNGAPVGVFTLWRHNVEAFTPRQIALVETFADQAVVAIENVRLFNETQEALEQQRASAEVLGAISRSIADASPVFETILDACQRLFGSEELGIYTIGDDQMVRVAAWRGPRAEEARQDVTPLADSVTGRVIRERRPHHIPDLGAVPNLSPTLRDRVNRHGGASLLYAPMVREDRGLGSIAVIRWPPRPFSDREQALLQTFADQAAIAIENVRLFDEVQARTRDLTEALLQQTATSDVLKAINRAAFDLDAVLETLVSTAVRLCNAKFGQIFRRHGSVYRYAGSPMDVDSAYLRHEQTTEIRPGRGTLVGRVALERRTIEIADAWNDPEYAEKEQARIGGVRAMLGVPLMRDGEPIGAFALARSAPIPFTPREAELVQTFADQAVIAIENVRLFTETNEALERQTATADILKVIASSPTDVQPVFEAIAASANTLIGGFSATVLRFVGDAIHLAAFTPTDPATDEVLTASFPRPLTDFPPFAAVRDGETIQFPDTEAVNVPPGSRELGRLRGFRSVVFAPLMSKNAAIGTISVTRREPGAFAADHVQLLKTFADQAVIAIENARLFDEVQARTREVEEALAQQTATAEVLKVISRSAFDLQAVFDTLLASAVELTGAAGGAICMRQESQFVIKSVASPSPAYRSLLGRTMPIDRSTPPGRALLSGKIELIADNRTDSELRPVQGPPLPTRSNLAVPLSRDGRVEGVISLVHPEPDAFTQRHIDLVQTFADQAVIAIENVRLFDEVQARTRDIEEALQQQTATADVLKVISHSVSDVAPVFETILESCQRLLGLESVAVYLVEGDMVRGVAQRGWKGGDWGRDVAPLAGSSTGIAIAERRPLHFPDLAEKPDLPEDKRTAVREAGGVTVLYAPMLLEDSGVGSIVVSRMPARPFSEKEIALAQSFADQAAIAIQNARMFDEVQARTRDVEEALAQQTATADVLKVISRSAFDLDVVFEALLGSAVSLFGSRGGTICVRDGEAFRYRAVAEGRNSAMWEYLSTHPPTPGRASLAGRVLVSGKPEIIADTLLDSDLKVPVHSLAGSRSIAGVPLLRDDRVEGALMVGRAEAGPFDTQEIELLQTFADQAVIAIENARLFEEVQARTRDLEESLAQQTATADVLKVISRSAFDLQVVFDTLLTSAVRLAGAAAGSMCVRDGSVFPYRAHSELSPSLVEHLLAHPGAPGRGSTVDRVLQSGEVVCIADVLEDPEYALPTMRLGTSMRSTLGVPLLRDNRVEGALVLVRLEPGTFQQRQIDTVKTFADQAVIAIENVRLFDEVQARTRELAASLDDLRKAQDRLIQSEKLASLGQLTAGIAHEIKNPLNFVNNFSALSRELVGELTDLIKAAPMDDTRREEAEELMTIIGGNLDKVVQHGKRADSIVKNMLLHSREGSGERSETNINTMVEEALNLAYHGMRAEKPGFNVTIVKSLDPNAGWAEVYAQEMTRVLLNLISNGFYATSKRNLASGDGAYEPTMTASTRDLGTSVEIAIRDNGTGISEEVKAKMFNPFFTTKPAGEGTGLGLSLSHDIVVKQHGGTIEVATEAGEYTQFTIVLPRAGSKA